MKILHFSPVKKPSEITSLHLKSLEDLNIKGLDFTFSFFDDNDDSLSSLKLANFVSKHKAILFTNKDVPLEKHNNKKSDERWPTNAYKRITLIKNFAIHYFLKEDYDFLFFTDSDLILHPETIKTLLKQKKNFCSEIFWTKFDYLTTYAPNGWYSKPYGYTKEDLINFKNKGTFQVDYTGACTLLSRKILEDKVSFKKIPSLDLLGEDKHFCIRASVMGYKIFMNTDYPAFHLYNASLLSQGEEFIKSEYNLSYLNNWLDSDWENKLDYWLGEKNTKKVSLIKKIKKIFK